MLSDARQGGKNVLVLREVSNGHVSLPGGNVATNESPIEALTKRLYHQLGMEGHGISEERLIAIDSEIRDGFPQTRLVLVYNVVPIWTLDLILPNVHKDWEAKILPTAQVSDLLQTQNPIAARRFSRAFDVARYGRYQSMNLRNGHPV